MRKLIIIGGLIGMTGLVSACGSSGMFDRERPDEFAVSRQAPLVIPPDFSLEPPRPGAPRPQSTTASDQALEALFGGPQARSVSEASALQKAGSAAPGIRSSVGDAATELVDKGAVTRDIVSAPEGDGQDASASVPQ